MQIIESMAHLYQSFDADGDLRDDEVAQFANATGVSFSRAGETIAGVKVEKRVRRRMANTGETYEQAYYAIAESPEHQRLVAVSVGKVKVVP